MIGELYDPRKTFGKAVTELAEENDRIVIFSADSGKSSGFGDFMSSHPERYFECGIMEQGVVGMAAGMAASGKIPIFCAIAPFVTARPFEMVRNDVGYMKQNVKLVGRNCGITYSDLGATHQSLDDFGVMRMIPGMTILAPQDTVEIEEAVKSMVEYEGPVYMRIGNPKQPQLFERKPFVIGKATVLKEGTDATVISTGSTTKDVLMAADMLAEKGINVRVVGMPTVYPIDEKLVSECADMTGIIFTVEEHYKNGGLGTIVSEFLSDRKDVCVQRIGMPNDYAVTCSDYQKLLEHYKLDAMGIADTVQETLFKK